MANTMAHPRVSGENHIIPILPGKKQGSSPRERGKREGIRLGYVHLGLIPA